MGLAFEITKSTSPLKQAEAIVKTLQELQTLHVSDQNAQRANLFNKLVTELRGLNNEAITSLLPKLIQVSRYFFNGCNHIFRMTYGIWLNLQTLAKQKTSGAIKISIQLIN